MGNVAVIGGGAAGMMAAVAAAGSGHRVRIYEKNEKLGKKLYITGKGRCNLTNACGTEEMLAKIVRNGKFLYSSFYGFSNRDMMAFMEENGCPVKVERGDRVFPVSDKSSDVIRVFSRKLETLGTECCFRKEVEDIRVSDGRVTGVVLKEGKKFAAADCVVVATGGISYPVTGSTGDGYRFAKRLGHTVTKLAPALVPFEVKELDVARSLQGLSLRNVQVRVLKGKKVLYEDFGEMLFTHFGVSGPVILSASSYVADPLEKGELVLSIDLKPALDYDQLDKRILRDFEKRKNRQYKNALDDLLPSKIIPVMIERSRIQEEKAVNEITRGERRQLVETVKDFRMTVTGMRGYEEAIVTRGGVSVKEVNPATMESKLVKGLYFAGEVLDVDGITGGFNLQAAWSTGFLAGSSAAAGV